MARTILYIDDDRSVLEGFESALEAEGYRVVFTDCARAAIEIASAEPPDLVLLEIRLGSCDGFDLLDEIRSLPGPASQVPVIVLTRASRSPSDYGRALGLGAADFLTKPVRTGELIQAIRDACADKHASEILLTQSIPSRTLDVALSGDLASTPLSEVLARLHDTGARGVLLVEKGRVRVGIQLRNGSPVALASNREIEPLEDYFLRIRKITKKQLDDVITQTESGLGSVREVVVGMGLLSEQEVDAALALRTNELLTKALKWQSGRFRFGRGRTLESTHTLEIQRPPLSVVWEAALEHTSDEQIRRSFGRQSLRYPSAALALPDREGREGLDAPSPSQQQLLSEIDGSRSVADFLESAGATRRMLFALWLTGSVELLDAPVLVLTEEVCEGSSSAEDLSTAPMPEERREDASRNSGREPVAEETETLDQDQRLPRGLEAEDWFRKGERLLAAKRYDEAVEAFGMSSHLDPGEGEYVSHLGYAMYLAAPRDDIVPREALEHIANGIKLSPNSVKPYLYMAKITKLNEDYLIARKLYLRVLTIDPDCHEAHQELRLMERRNQKGNRGFMNKMRRKRD